MKEDNYIKPVKKTKNPNCFVIGNVQRKTYVYRYMPIVIALKCFCNGNIKASQPDQWSDKFEGRFYNADYSQLGVSDDTHPRLWAFCTSAHESCEASWDRYRLHTPNNADDELCLHVKINRKKLLEQLSLYATEKSYTIYEGAANYFLNTWHIKTLHLKYFDWQDSKGGTNTNEVTAHSLFFDDFSLEKYLNLMLIKRKEFEYEAEIRYFIVPEDGTNIDKECFVPLRWNDIIEEIKVDSRYKDFGGLVAKLKNKGLNVVVKDDSQNKYDQKKYSDVNTSSHIIWISSYDVNHDADKTIIIQK